LLKETTRAFDGARTHDLQSDVQPTTPHRHLSIDLEPPIISLVRES